MTHSKVAFMFAGQGSQYFQMGRALYDEQAVFRHTVDSLDGTVRMIAGESIVNVLYRSGRAKADVFNDTLLTNAAIFVIQYALAQALIGSGVKPGIVIGTSLGAFVAAAIAECVDPHDILGELMEHAKTLKMKCEPGTMISVLANVRFFEEAGLGVYSELAGVNFDTHFVVAATLPGAQEIERILRARGVVFQHLSVSFAFHSRWTRAAEEPMNQRLAKLRLFNPRIPFACCASAEIVSDAIGARLLAAVREPIRFQETICVVESAEAWEYVDLSPSATLSTITKYACVTASSASRIHPTMTPYGNDVKNFAAVIGKLGSHKTLIN